MRNNINFYPTLTDELISKLNPKTTFEFYYECVDENVALNFTNEDGQISFDESSNWNCDDYDLQVTLEVNLENTNCLFGENGVAPINSKLGLALEWYSTSSKIREVITVENDIVNGLEHCALTFDTCFPKSTFSGVITLNLILYLKEKSTLLSKNEHFLNNEEGINLGIINNNNIFMTGNGSLFPIKIEALNINRLWDLQINYEDLNETLFSEGIALVLNSNHRDYKYIDPNNNCYCERLADEIVSNAIVLLLCHIKENEGLDILNKNSVPGSIMEFLCYCKDTLDINFSSSLEISKTVKKLLEEGDE